MHDHAQQPASGTQPDAVAAKQDGHPGLTLGTVPLAGLAGHTDRPVQRKLAVGSATDPAEAEADEIARRVLERLRDDGDGPVSPPPAEHRDAISRSVAGPGDGGPAIGPAGGDLPADLERGIAGHRGSGQPMPHALRRRMEGAFGADFSGVRLHVGEHARALNDGMQAAAFTAGKDIFFRDGMPRADRASDQMLLAHELTHTVQQGDSPVLRTLRETDPETVRLAAATATEAEQPIRRWGVGKKKTADDEKATTKKPAKKSAKKVSKGTSKKTTKKASSKPTKSTSSAPKKTTTGAKPPTTGPWTSSKPSTSGGTGGATIGGHRTGWTTTKPTTSGGGGTNIGGHRTGWTTTKPTTSGGGGGATIGGHRTKPDTTSHDSRSDPEGASESKDTPYSTVPEFEGGYSGGNTDDFADGGTESKDSVDTGDELSEESGGEESLDSEGATNGRTQGFQPYATFHPSGSRTGVPPTPYTEVIEDDSKAHGTDTDSDSDSDGSVEEDEKFGTTSESKDTVYESDIPSATDTTDSTSGAGTHDPGTAPVDEKSEDAQLDGSAPPPKSKRKARNLAKLKEEYEEERTSQRNDLVKVIKAEAGIIASVYDALDRVRDADPDDEDELEDIIDDCPKGLADILTGQPYEEVLRRLTAIHSKKMEQAKRQDLPINEEGELGDISARMVAYDEGPDAQKRTEVTVEGGLLKRSDGRPVDTEGSSTFHSGLGVEIFVVGETGDIHMESHKIGKYHHSSLLAGANVSMAGEMKVTNGKIDWMSNKSGHYQPSTVHFVQFLHQVEKAGVALAFEVKGWGIDPPGQTAEEYLDNLSDEDSYEFIKTKTMWKGLIEEFGKDAVKAAIREKGWKANGSKGTEVTDADGDDVSMEEVRRVLKEKFGKGAGKSRLVQAPSADSLSGKTTTWV